MQMIATRQPKHFSQHSEVNAMIWVSVENSVHRAVNVQKHSVVATPVCKTSIRRKSAGEIVMHDNWCAYFFSVFGSLVHFFWSRGGHVEIVTFALTCLSFRFVNRLHDKIESLTPAHKWL